MRSGNLHCSSPEELERLRNGRGYVCVYPNESPPPEGSGRRVITISIVAMGAVRQNKSDAWKQRPAVLRYREYQGKLRSMLGVGFMMPPSGYHLTFYLPIPKSWSAKKKAAMEGKPHCSKPDKDNLEKGFLDTVLCEDSHIWDGRASKRWSANPRIELDIEPQGTSR